MLHFCNFYMQRSSETCRITIHNESTSKALYVSNSGGAVLNRQSSISRFFLKGIEMSGVFFFVLPDLAFTLKCNKPNSKKRENNHTTKTLFAFPLSILQEVTAFTRIELLWFYTQRKGGKNTMQVIPASQKNISIIHLFGLVTNYSASPQQ